MRVLVTGHEGYLGSVLAERLLEGGHSVVGLDVGYFADCTIGPAPVEVPTLRTDLRDVVAHDLREVDADAVIHLAGLSNDSMGNLDPELTRRINHEGTMRLAGAAKAAGIARFLFASSCSLYGASDRSLLVESSPLAPVTAYAESKMLSEQGLAELADDDFSPTFLRKATAYGFSPRLRLDLAVNDLVGRAVTTGRVLLLSDGLAMRPFVHVEDIASVYSSLLLAPREKVHAATYNVGRTGENHRIRDVAELVAQAVPGSVVEYSSSLDADVRDYRVSCEHLATELPDLQLEWTVERGVEQLVRAYRDHGLDLESLQGERFRRLGRITALRQCERIDPSLRWVAPTAAHPLPEGLVGDYGGCDPDVEGVDAAEHGEFGPNVRAREELVGEAVLLRPDQDRDGAGEVQIRDQVVGVGRGGHDEHAMTPRPGQELLRRDGGDGNREDGALAGPDDVGVAPVGHGVDGHDRCGARGVRGAQDGAQVARLLDGLAHDQQRCRPEVDVGESALDAGDHSQPAVRAVPIGRLLERRAADVIDRGVERSAGLEAARVPGHEFGTQEQLQGPDPGCHRQIELLVPLDEAHTLLVAHAASTQRDQTLDLGVGRTGDLVHGPIARRQLMDP